jgi:hypothetical protein
VDSVDLPAVRGTVVIWAVLFFLIGYALYATIFGTLGSLASRTEDASSVAGPVTIVLVLGFMVSFAAIGSADSTWARLVSWFPLTAPTAMPNRVAMGAATWWDPIVAVVLTVATILGLVYVGGRIYTRAILHTGATMKLGDAWHGTPRTGGVEARRADNPRFDRRVIVAIVVAVTTGAMTFALTRDLVISVGVAAAGYAISDRALRAWRRPPSARGPARRERISH